MIYLFTSILKHFIWKKWHALLLLIWEFLHAPCKGNNLMTYGCIQPVADSNAFLDLAAHYADHI